MPPASSSADERAPPSLIERGLRSAIPGRTISDRAIAAAAWLPELRLHAIVEHHVWPTQSRLETVVLGELAWPLGRSPAGDTISGVRERRQRETARDALVARIVAAWHARSLADDAADDVAARLAEEEADATLDALDGDAAEDEP